jgi:hypothetical protein
MRGLENAGIWMVFLFISPIVLILIYRLLPRRIAPDPIGLEPSPRFQRMEQAIDSIAMEVEGIAEAQRFTTRILAERQSDAASRLEAPSLQKPDTIAPR